MSQPSRRSLRPRPNPLRWVVSDIDGTIVSSAKTVTPASREAAQRLQAAGIGLSLASSRPPWGMRHVAQALGLSTPLSGFNGALVMDQSGKALQVAHIPAAATDAALTLLATENIGAWVFTDKQWLIRDANGSHVDHERHAIQSDPAIVPDFRPWRDQACKIVGVSDDHDHLAEVAERMAALLGRQANAGLSQKYYLDITPPGVNKGAAVSFVSDACAIPSANIAAIGDMDNDVAMFQAAGYAIAMGNGSPAALAAADMITRDNNSEGFAFAMNALLGGAGATG